MARVAQRVRDPQVAEALQSALERGWFAPSKACRVVRALGGHSQADFAAHLGVSVKVIKALESGRGNPRYASLEKIAGAMGLSVAFVKPSVSVDLLDPAERAKEARRRRLADAQALASGDVSEGDLHRRNALRVDDVEFELPELA
jgi:transcriptional regulator with XRE-family HTH domain